MTSYDYQQALKNAAKSMVRVRNPKRLLKMISRFIDREVGLTHTSILMYDVAKDRYVFIDSKGDRKLPINLIRLDSSNDLIQWFSRREKKVHIGKDFLFYKQIKEYLSDDHILEQDPTLEKRLKNLKEKMEILRACVCVPGFYKNELLGVLILGEKIDKSDFTIEEISFFQTLANDASMTIKVAQYHEDLIKRNKELELHLKEIQRLRQKERQTYYQIILSLAREVHARDAYTYGHLEEVEKLGILCAEEMDLDLSGRKKDILVASLQLHDVGKIGVPEHILKKPGPLSAQEWGEMRQHAEKGAKILEPLEDFKEVAEIVKRHHENYDGSGYPDGLKGEEIPVEARIIAVVDAFHAIVSTRCYRKGQSFEYAIKEIERCAGSQFDPKVVESFVRAIRKSRRLFKDCTSQDKDGQPKGNTSLSREVSVPKIPSQR